MYNNNNNVQSFDFIMTIYLCYNIYIYMYVNVCRCNIFIYIYCIFIIWSYNVHDAFFMQFLSRSCMLHIRKTKDKYFKVFEMAT